MSDDSNSRIDGTREIARRYLDLWDRQALALAGDPRFAETMRVWLDAMQAAADEAKRVAGSGR